MLLGLTLIGENCAAKAGLKWRDLADDDLLKRYLFPLGNEKVVSVASKPISSRSGIIGLICPLEAHIVTER